MSVIIVRQATIIMRHNEQKLIGDSEAKRPPTEEGIARKRTSESRDLAGKFIKLQSETLHHIQNLSQLLIADRVSTRRTWRTTSWRQGTTLRF